MPRRQREEAGRSARAGREITRPRERREAREVGARRFAVGCTAWSVTSERAGDPFNEYFRVSGA